eukprot:g60294.t1
MDIHHSFRVLSVALTYSTKRCSTHFITLDTFNRQIMQLLSQHLEYRYGDHHLPWKNPLFWALQLYSNNKQNNYNNNHQHGTTGIDQES